MACMNPFEPDTLRTLAQRHGTPLWVYDAHTVRARIASLRPFDTLRYAQKANANIHLLRLMRGMGVKVDAVSLGEIERALAAGYTLPGPLTAADGAMRQPPGADDRPAPDAQGEDDIVFTADLFDRATLDRVVAGRITVNAGSIDMLQQLGACSPGHRVWLRINPGFGHGHSQKTNTGGEQSKHGIWHADLAAALDAVRAHRLHLVGLHMHIGSGVDYTHLQQVCQAMVDLADRAFSLSGSPLEAISAGGGLSVPYRAGEPRIDVAHYFSLWDAARQRIAAQQRRPLRLEIEPGRYLVAEAGVLLAEVRAVKDMGRQHFVLVDAGFSDLARPSLYGSFHEISVLPAPAAHGAGAPADHAASVTAAAAPQTAARALKPTVVAGPLCESGDVFTQGEGGVVLTRDLPPARVGDLLVLHDAGAYGASMSSNYNSRPLIAEVLVDGGESRLIRRRQTVQELLALEAV
jgi:diaminopimelate decarboxylase